MIEVKSKEIWEKVKNNLKNKNTNNHFLHTWLEPAQILKIEQNENTSCFILSVPSELHKYWLSQKLVELISSEISILHQKPFTVQLIVKKEPKKQKKKLPLKDPLSHFPIKQKTFSPLKNNSSSQKQETLNPHYTFSHFIVGRNNEFAHAASFHVAKNPKPKPKESYNPLFIYGPTGMGKTHLLHAIGNHIHQKHPDLRVKYSSSEQFLNEFVSGIRRNEMDQFRKNYRDSCDVLLMDDIQILKKGEASQEEFFHTLNHFFTNEKQIIFASDKMPKDIEGLKDRIRTRLEWGLIADIKIPDQDTRMAILKYKSERLNIQLPHEIALYLANISKRSVRELEGNLNKIKMFSELRGKIADLESIKKLFSSHHRTSPLTAQDIQKITAKHYKIKLSDLKSKSRSQPIVQARQISMFFIKKYLHSSLAEIGKNFGKKDHTTVLNAIKKIELQKVKNSSLKKDLEAIETAIHLTTGS